MDYILYKDSNNEYTIILADGCVYSFDEYNNAMMLDGEMNMNTPYPHLGEVVSIDDIKKKSIRMFVNELINME